MSSLIAGLNRSPYQVVKLPWQILDPKIGWCSHRNDTCHGILGWNPSLCCSNPNFFQHLASHLSTWNPLGLAAEISFFSHDFHIFHPGPTVPGSPGLSRAEKSQGFRPRPCRAGGCGVMGPSTAAAGALAASGDWKLTEKRWFAKCDSQKEQNLIIVKCMLNNVLNMFFLNKHI